jgi:hypothetical protein
MSELPGRYEVKLARYCAKQYLESSGAFPPLITPGGPGEELPEFTAEEEEQYLIERKAGLKKMRERVANMIAESHVPLLAAIPSTVIEWFLKSKFDALAEDARPETEYEFRIQVPDKRFELDGKGLADKDIAPLLIDEEFQLVTFAAYTRSNPTTKRWSGVHIKEGSQAIEVFKDSPLAWPDRSFCTIRLPTLKMQAAADKLPYPVFTAIVKPSDKDKHLPSSHWELSSAAVGLETELLQ